MFVKPAANPAFDEKAPESRANPRQYLVYDPALQDYLPGYGRDVGPDNKLYWHRLLMSGDAIELSAAEGNAAIEAEAARQKSEKARADAAEAEEKKKADALAAKDQQAAASAAKVGK